MAVYNQSLDKLTIHELNVPDTFWRFYPYLSKDKEYKLFFASGDNGYLMKMKKKDYYLLGYLIHPAIYFGIFLFIFMIKRMSAYQMKLKEDQKNRLLTLQLQSIKSQLDPHFTFNTLNSIASLIYLEDRETAYDYMHKFTELLRNMLNNAEKIYLTLGEEINFVKTYLELEKMRFGNKFDFNIEIGKGITLRELVPKLVLQTFVENALKHGILPAEKAGILNIIIVREKGYLLLTIEDNGIGREMSKGHSNGTEKGLKLTSEFYEILNSINKRPIRYLITDLYNTSGEPAGTKVEVRVPDNDLTDNIKS